VEVHRHLVVQDNPEDLRNRYGEFRQRELHVPVGRQQGAIIPERDRDLHDPVHAVEGELLVRVPLSKVTARKGIAD